MLLSFAIAILGGGDFGNAWPSVHKVRAFGDSETYYACVDPLASHGKLVGAGQVVLLDSDLQPIAKAVGAEFGERFGAGVIVPHEINPYWDVAIVGRRGPGLSVSFWTCSGDTLELVSHLVWDLSPAAEFIGESWNAKAAPTEFTFYATVDQQLHVCRVKFGSSSETVESEPWRQIDVGHDVATVVIANEESGSELWLLGAETAVVDGAAELVIGSVKGGSAAVERKRKVRLENPPWQSDVVRPIGTQKSVQLKSVRSLHAESSPDRLNVWLRVIVVADGSVEKEHYEAVRVQVHKLPVQAFLGASDGVAATGDARCVAIFGESLTDEPIARKMDDFESWTPWISNWGRQIFDVSNVEVVDGVDLVLVDKWSRQLEGRNLEILRTSNHPFVIRASGPVAAFYELVQSNGVGILVGGGIVVERDSAHGSVILFASRSRLEPWPEPFDFTGAQVEASARGEGTRPSMTVFNLRDWKFELVGAILDVPKHATSEPAKPAPEVPRSGGD